MLVQVPGEGDDDPLVLRPRDVIDTSDMARKAWVDGMKQFVESREEDHHIRPLNFLFFPNGSVEPQPSNQMSTESSLDIYLSAYRIPPETISDLEPKEKVRRAELFALGCMIYELYANKASFEGLEDDDIQARYRRGHFPEVTHLPQWPIILSCWSVEFASDLYAILSK